MSFRATDIGPPVATGRRTGWLVALAAAIAAVGLVYRDTFLSMVDKWNDDTAFSYGFVVVPIALWLVWRRRARLSRVEFEPSWFGAMAAIGAAMLWLVAKGTGVLVVEQAAVVLTIQALVFALLGWRAIRVLL